MRRPHADPLLTPAFRGPGSLPLNPIPSFNLFGPHATLAQKPPARNKSPLPGQGLSHYLSQVAQAGVTPRPVRRAETLQKFANRGSRGPARSAEVSAAAGLGGARGTKMALRGLSG